MSPRAPFEETFVADGAERVRGTAQHLEAAAAAREQVTSRFADRLASARGPRRLWLLMRRELAARRAVSRLRPGETLYVASR